VPGKITRHCSPADFDKPAALREKETVSVTQVQKLAESCGLGIKIVDVEFQVDGNKLTVFYSSKVFVDFRKFQRSLFREHRCRIWLINWNEIRRPSCPGMRH
jgi:cell fate regulator YaaT (PSP1 superfamily)